MTRVRDYSPALELKRRGRPSWRNVGIDLILDQYSKDRTKCHGEEGKEVGEFDNVRLPVYVSIEQAQGPPES